MTTLTLRGLAAGVSAYAHAPVDSRCSDLSRTDYPPLLPGLIGRWVDVPDDGYPSYTRAEAALAAQCGTTADRVLLTAGGDDGLARIFRAALRPGLTALLTTPTFEMLPRFAALAGGSVRSISWEGEALSIDDFTSAMDETVALVCLATPNNPTGSVVATATLRGIAERFPAALLVVDLAYVDFAEEDPTIALLDLPNVIIVRTFSKIWGLAASRLGYLIASPEIIPALRGAGLPFPVSGASARLLEATLQDPNAGALRESRKEQVRANRSVLAARLNTLGLTPLPSEGNFVACTGPRIEWVSDALRSLKIITRMIRTTESSYLRVTVPIDEAMLESLTSALRVSLRPSALLFDLDGVVADVSHSYRAAIMATAAEFGVTVSSADIQKIKSEGNANDDWSVTHRLIERAGVPANLAEVTAAFEQCYQGSADVPGLRQEEKLIFSRSILESLARRFPLAIVTGRPRLDAERFLHENNLLDLFRVVVTREDATIKPDPAPVLLALKQLGVRRAWMFGDTLDDLVAAAAAGVIPIGIIAPGEDPLLATTTLSAAGAARVLRNIEEILPCLR